MGRKRVNGMPFSARWACRGIPAWSLMNRIDKKMPGQSQAL